MQAFFTSVTAFGHEKIKKQFFSKISSILERHVHITSLFSYTLQLEELLNLVFLLILRSQTYLDVAITSTH